MPEETDGNAPGIPELHGDIQQLDNGLGYIEEAEGDGASPAAGQNVTVHYRLAHGRPEVRQLTRQPPPVLVPDRHRHGDPRLGRGCRHDEVGAVAV